MADGFPELFDIRSFGRAMDQGFNQIVANYGETLEAIFLPVLKALVMMEKVLLWLPWWGVLLALAALAYAASRRWTVTVAVAVMTFCIGVIGVWEQAMATIALMVISTLLAVLVGLPIGIAMSRGKRMQAVRAFGASPLQILFSVQIPLAMPAILAGINQTTMMALSMVVIASMIGAGGLGYQVLQGIQRLEISSGLMAGLGIVLLAIIFDRIAQSYGQRMQKSLKLES